MDPKRIINNTLRPGSDTDDGPELTTFIQGTDEANAVARPANIDKFYLEDEYTEAEEVQRKLYEEKGEEEAEPHESAAKALEFDALKAQSESNASDAHAKLMRKEHESAEKVLGKFARRSTDAVKLKWIRLGGILGGDAAAITGAAILIGEEPYVAAIQGISVATCAITAGSLGRHVRYIRDANDRAVDPADLTKDQKQFQQFFMKRESSGAIMKALVAMFVLITLLIATGILIIRTSGEGWVLGAAFFCFAVALTLASFFNSWDTADEVAEFIDANLKRVTASETVAAEHRANPVIREYASELAAAATARARNKAAGEAAAAEIRRRLYAALGNSGGVAGNGTAASPTTQLEELVAASKGATNGHAVKEA